MVPSASFFSNSSKTLLFLQPPTLIIVDDWLDKTLDLPGDPLSNGQLPSAALELKYLLEYMVFDFWIHVALFFSCFNHLVLKTLKNIRFLATDLVSAL